MRLLEIAQKKNIGWGCMELTRHSHRSAAASGTLQVASNRALPAEAAILRNRHAPTSAAFPKPPTELPSGRNDRSTVLDDTTYRSILQQKEGIERFPRAETWDERARLQ